LFSQNQTSSTLRDLYFFKSAVPPLEKTALFKNGVFWVTNAGENEPSFDFASRTKV
jgi:hypothetical protein